MTGTVEVKVFFHEPTFTVSYVVWDRATLQAAIVDPVLDYDPKSGAAGRESLDQLLEFVRKNNLQAIWPLESGSQARRVANTSIVSESGIATPLIAAITVPAGSDQPCPAGRHAPATACAS